ncbi:MAG: MalY/PatB family protein [Succinivibrionaceae bacterium]
MYNFDEIIDRNNTNSLKWNIKPNELPMWVADMDFKTAPEITEAIIKRAQHGIFGYSIIPKEWNQSIVNWWHKYHNFDIDPNSLVFCTGVVPALSSIIRKLTTPAEKVLIQTPVYNIFFNSIINNGRFVVENKLFYNGENFDVNFYDLEKKLADPQTSLMILCNPHNPIGKIWDKETLAEIGELCKKHNVIVVSDEIHCDLTDPNEEYIPFASVNETCANNSITCIAPSKTFNIAGLHSAAIFSKNDLLRYKVTRGLNTDEVAEPNAFAIDATIAAYTYGRPWLTELRSYIYNNKLIVRDFIEKEIPQLKLVPNNATYLLWLDCSKFTYNSTELATFIRKNTGLWLSAGNQYGGTGKTFLRLNIACPKERLLDGLSRLKRGIEEYGDKYSLVIDM